MAHKMGGDPNYLLSGGRILQVGFGGLLGREKMEILAEKIAAGKEGGSEKHQESTMKL